MGKNHHKNSANSDYFRVMNIKPIFRNLFFVMLVLLWYNVFMDRGKNVNRSTLVLFSALTLILGFVGGSRIDDIRNLIAPVFGLKKVEKIDFSNVEKTYQALVSNYDGEIDKQKIIEGASKGLVEAAGDKYTEYMTSKEAEEFNKSLSGDVGLSGLGQGFCTKSCYNRYIWRTENVKCKIVSSASWENNV